MRRNAMLIILAAVLLLLAASAGELPPARSALPRPEPLPLDARVLKKAEPTPPPEPEPPEPGGSAEPAAAYAPEELCFIGDSRTLHISYVVNSKARFISKGGQGVDWFRSEAREAFHAIHSQVRVCIVALGINDVFNLDMYLSQLNRFADKYPDIVMVYVNVGPVNRKLYRDVSPSKIQKFNKKMAEGLSDRWRVLDLYGFLSEEGFTSWDGLHYYPETSRRIYDWIVQSVQQPA